MDILSKKHYMNSQNINNLRGEIEFRKRLATQHVTGEMLLPDYYDKEQHDKILLERVNTTLEDLKKLEKQVSLFSPFIELGAERCQRALVLTNDFNAEGFAVDISYHQLKTAGHFAGVFNRPKLPFRVCCDVNNLPFRSNSFPFAYCYEFLHHFPSPKPILQEIYRILSNGVFFFSEEPFKRPRIALYRQRHKIYSRAMLGKNKARRFIEKFISEDICDERDYGIIENDDITLNDWIDALAIFDAKKVHISSLGNRIRTELGERIKIKNLLNMFLGGGVNGICTKQSGVQGIEISNLADLLLCPDCLTRPIIQKLDQSPLIKKMVGSFDCSVCNSSFPVIDDILFLLPTGLFRELYPDFASR